MKTALWIIAICEVARTIQAALSLRQYGKLTKEPQVIRFESGESEEC